MVTGATGHIGNVLVRELTAMHTLVLLSEETNPIVGQEDIWRGENGDCKLMTLVREEY